MSRPTLVFTILALLCFALPFFVVSCEGHAVQNVTGINLVTGGDVPASLTSATPQHVPPDIWAIGAVAFGLIGLVLVVVRLNNPSREGISTAAVLCTAAVCLILVRLSARDALTHQFVLGVRVGYGYYLALFFMLAAAVLSVLGVRQSQPRSPTSSA